MKRGRLHYFIISFFILLILPLNLSGKKLGISVGSEFYSSYFWRGMDFYGENRPVFFPWISYSKFGVTLMASGEFSPDILTDEANSTEKEWAGADYKISYANKFLDEKLSVEVGFWYFWYPNDKSEQEDRAEGVKGYDVDFAQYYLVIGAPKVILSPTLKFAHYIYVSDRDGAKETFEDWYIMFSISHSFDIAERTSLKLGVDTTYFNYSSNDIQGISDVVLYSKVSTSFKNGLSIYGSFNLGFVPLDQLSNEGEDNFKYFLITGLYYSF